MSELSDASIFPAVAADQPGGFAYAWRAAQPAPILRGRGLRRPLRSGPIQPHRARSRNA
ncbi:hypothetical protein PUN4_60026 [Paraburkholderia unamae]|nr:hypothetical protein PUN4_60026 [Paraburkholderia unamae]